MHLRILPLLCTLGLFLALGHYASAADADNADPDEQTLKAAGLGTDGPALLEFFRKRAEPSLDREKLTALIAQLGDKTPEARDRAAGEIVSQGTSAIPLLRQAVKDPDDQEIATRALRCLQQIEGGAANSIPAAAARLLVQRKQAGAVEALLAYLPFADDDTVVDEVKAALTALAWNDGKANPAILSALEDKVPIRRSVAAEALGRASAGQTRQTIAKLLKDPKPTVRLRVALLLSDLWDEKSVETLIALLEELPPGLAKQAEDQLVNLFGDSRPKVALGADLPARQKCRAAWTTWWGDLKPDGLLDEFRKRTLTDADREKIQALIKQLGDESFETREKALADLKSRGMAVVSLVRQAVGNPDPEISYRARRCLQDIEKEKSAILPAATFHMIAFRKPAGAAEVLLAWVPFAEDDSLRDELRITLTALAERDGKADPALLNALGDKLPLRRAIAAEAVCQAGLREHFPAVMKLLQDEQPVVRLRAAVALAGARQKEAIPALIGYTAELPLEQAGQADDYLRSLAGAQSPTVVLGKDPADRQKCRDAWTTWWQKQGDKIDLAAANTFRQLGYTLLVFPDNAMVSEIASNGKERWQLTGLRYPFDAQVLPGDRVLVAEFHGACVTERTLKNEIVWTRQANMPISAQRLSNGNTFIVTRNQLLEVDKTGKETFTYNRPNHDIMAARRLTDGRVACVLNSGTCTWLDAAGKETKSFATGPIQFNGMDALPSGRVVVAQINNNRVVEYDADGKMVWEATVQQPTSVVRLPSGNTLVASQLTSQIVELDRGGKVVWEHKSTLGRPWRAQRR